ncbi:hypothetical protein PanWU01x14_028570 [Parasponia andersonii]|uniref:Uncharacterized protein n=1 Tax=Parasponia andersonii TaxID=3476 RepID=A0A2P5DVC9_PARAD|nr:hypothetical protein PanWU01x14_028570 [Parasponia andersonii]
MSGCSTSSTVRFSSSFITSFKSGPDTGYVMLRGIESISVSSKTEATSEDGPRTALALLVGKVFLWRPSEPVTALDDRLGIALSALPGTENSSALKTILGDVLCLKFSSPTRPGNSSSII